ncbi:helix-turn-helix domain-containing protein [uncultured Anaerofustis sp.]|uniref:helix-turn-helix domain-containing protein n=1 Tax=uncultured Anaerofustis sp. TaxID=904996 RepID=UPI0025DEDDFE|nr:helix-turn-helix domain-containing protein [uncultured Anaerofustis sp.]
MDNFKGYYSIIPAHVRYDRDLTPNAKLLYAEITSLCNEKGYCWANNSYFAELYGVTTVSISKWIKSLAEKGYITTEIEYKKGSKEILKRYIRIVNDPIKEMFNTPQRKVKDPIKQKFKDNNKNIILNINTIKEYIKGEPEELEKSIIDFMYFRNEIKKPLTSRAMTRFIKRLNELSDGDIKEKIAIIDQSIRNNWQDIYELKKNNNSKSKKETIQSDIDYEYYSEEDIEKMMSEN